MRLPIMPTLSAFSRIRDVLKPNLSYGKRTYAVVAQSAIRGLLLGAPGAGKGTQSTRILAKFPSLTILSSGDLLRSNIQAGTQLGVQIKSAIAEGKLVDDVTISKLIISHLTPTFLSSENGFFLDGFPRTVSQAKTLDAYLEEMSCPLNFVANLDVPHSVILDRIVNRWIHAASGRTYNMTFNPPKVDGLDDVTGEKLTRRADDDAQTLKKRLDEYQANTKPLIDYYRSRGILKNFAGQTSDIIWPQLQQALILHAQQ